MECKKSSHTVYALERAHVFKPTETPKVTEKTGSSLIT